MDAHETGIQVIRILVDIFNISQNREGAGYRWVLVALIPQYPKNKKKTAITLVMMPKVAQLTALSMKPADPQKLLISTLS